MTDAFDTRISTSLLPVMRFRTNNVDFTNGPFPHPPDMEGVRAALAEACDILASDIIGKRLIVDGRVMEDYPLLKIQLMIDNRSDFRLWSPFMAKPAQKGHENWVTLPRRGMPAHTAARVQKALDRAIAYAQLRWPLENGHNSISVEYSATWGDLSNHQRLELQRLSLSREVSA